MTVFLRDGRNPQLLTESQLAAAYSKACSEGNKGDMQAIEIERDRREALSEVGS